MNFKNKTKLRNRNKRILMLRNMNGILIHNLGILQRHFLNLERDFEHILTFQKKTISINHFLQKLSYKIVKLQFYKIDDILTTLPGSHPSRSHGHIHYTI